MMHAPQAPKRPKRLVKHGDVRIDDYFWLRDRKDPATLKYLQAENAHFEEKMKPLGRMRDRLFREMKARIRENDSSAPAPDGAWMYYRKYKKGLQYEIDCRKPRKGGREQVVLDHNRLAKGKAYFHTTGFVASPDHERIAYSVDFDGSERYDVRIRNLRSQRDLPVRLKNTNGSFEWSQDGKFLFYVVLDKSLRPYRVYRHRLGDDPKRDELLFEEKDPKQFVGVGRSSSEKYLIVASAGKITTEQWFLDRSRPLEKLTCFEPRREGHEYNIDHGEGEWWIHTNARAKNFRVLRTAEDKIARRHWREVLPQSARTLRSWIRLFKNHLVVSERENGLPQIRIVDLRTMKGHIVAFTDAAYQASVHADNHEYDTKTLRLSYSSPIQPESVIDYGMDSRRRKVVKAVIVKGHKPGNYRCERLWVKSHDGVKVPMTILYRKGLKADGRAPGYLYGYGSYGMNMPDSFSGYRDIFRLVDRGFVYALAHIRGGSEMGRHWYETGKFLKKKNTFLDFIACAEFLGRTKRIDASRLAICGGSAGGLLMGACANMRPDLFHVVVAHVPFVDVLNTMLDKTLPLTPIEYKEWGNPADPKYYRYIKSYSPYDQVRPRKYPSFFVTCGLNDPRVTYWEPAKWVAKLRELKTDDNPIVFKTNMGAGHFGASGRFHHLYEQAEEYAFVLERLTQSESEKESGRNRQRRT